MYELLAIHQGTLRTSRIADVFAAGADIVQVDEPYLQARPDEARKCSVEARTRALDGVAGTSAVQIRFDYATIIRERPEGYSFLAELADPPLVPFSDRSEGSRLASRVG